MEKLVETTVCYCCNLEWVVPELNTTLEIIWCPICGQICTRGQQ